MKTLLERSRIALIDGTSAISSRDLSEQVGLLRLQLVDASFHDCQPTSRRRRPLENDLDVGRTEVGLLADKVDALVVAERSTKHLLRHDVMLEPPLAVHLHVVVAVLRNALGTILGCLTFTHESSSMLRTSPPPMGGSRCCPS